MAFFSKFKLNRSIMPILFFMVVSILIFTLFRTALVAWKYADCMDYLTHIYVYGLRYDISINFTLFAPALLLTLVFGFMKSTPKVVLILLKYYLALLLTVEFFIELTTIPFILEYGVRPNRIYVEYLKYPKEVFSMLLNGHIIEAIVCLVLSGVFWVLMLKLSRSLYAGYRNLSPKLNALVLLLVFCIVPLGIRGTLSYRPLNPSNASFCNSPLANTIPPNSTFMAYYYYRNLADDVVTEAQIYAFDTPENVLLNLNALSMRKLPEPRDESCPINQIISPKYKQDKPRNVVIILEESLGARYVGSLHGDPVAPNLDKLKDEGWWFERMYATGHRSVRGIEAVTAGFLPGPLSSQVKLEHPHGLTTIANIYKKLGYDTSFIYGGESHFDDMRTYFFNNGVEEVIEQKDFEDPEFTSSWGVSDEDVFKRANTYFAEKQKQHKPFCSLIFTTSFHDPFDIPEGKVSLPQSVKTDDPKRLTAAMYADYALGKFFEMAKKEDYYKNTVFLIIADHDSRVRALDAFPFTNYAIPALILSPDLKPFYDKRVVSQIDMLPTLLSLTGVSGQIPVVGQDLTQEHIVERAIISYNEIFGFYKPETLKILAPTWLTAYPVFAHNRVGEAQVLDKKDCGPEISYLNTSLVIYQHDWARMSCVKNLKQNDK